MTHLESSRLLGLALLGALHGVNPGMGWLFAVARGIQERSRQAVWAALGPLAVGHAAAIAVAIALAAALGAVVPIAFLRSLVGVALLTRGAMSLRRHRHPRGGGMQVSSRDLAWWSFLMATAHGAGLMALPLVLHAQAPGAMSNVHGMHGLHAGAQMSLGRNLEGTALLATAAHAAGYLVVTTLVAVLVYERVGVRVLRSAWINMDLLWSGALIVTGVATLLL